MTRGRKRQHNPSIPPHIDQGKIPNGCYWDNSGQGRWYVQTRENGKLRNQRIAGRDATLSDLHRICEEWHGIDRDTFDYIAGEFAKSPKFKGLAAATQTDYESFAVSSSINGLRDFILWTWGNPCFDLLDVF